MYRFMKTIALKPLNAFKQNERHFWKSCVRPQEQSLESLELPTSELDERIRTESMLQKAYKDALRHSDYFGVNKLFTVRQLFETRAHFGHKLGTLNEHMTPYIFGNRLGILIFDLDQTAERLREALNFTAHIAFRGGIILFINRSINTTYLVEKTAKECGEYSHCRDWRPDTFYDSTRIFGAVTRFPDLIIFLSTMNNVFETHPAVIDSAKLLIPTIGIVDTNSDPTLVTYPVPSNDDTYQTIELFCKLFKKSILLGKGKRNELLNEIKNYK